VAAGISAASAAAMAVDGEVAAVATTTNDANPKPKVPI
jgi:hypothetical protein